MSHTITWAHVGHRPNSWNPDVDPEEVGHGHSIFVLSEENLDLVEQMSVFHCLDSEIAHALRVSERVFTDRSKGKRLLRAVQFKAALAGNVTMLIFLGKVILNQIPGASININISEDGLFEPSNETRHVIRSGKCDLQGGTGRFRQ